MAVPVQAVREVFVHLHQDGLLYRGERLINWCPRCLTALSDIEVEHEDGVLEELYVDDHFEELLGRAPGDLRPRQYAQAIAVAVIVLAPYLLLLPLFVVGLARGVLVILDIIMELRKRYRVQIPEQDYPALASMASTVEYLLHAGERALLRGLLPLVTAGHGAATLKGGHVITGGVVSVKVMVWLQEARLLQSSVAVQVRRKTRTAGHMAGN